MFVFIGLNQPFKRFIWNFLLNDIIQNWQREALLSFVIIAEGYLRDVPARRL
jgi:hypothetical protein